MSAQESRPLTPKPWYEQAWEQVIACAGGVSDQTTTFAQIHWMERDTIPYLPGMVLLGEWVPPDTIFITKGMADTAWVVAHEMLHHRLGKYNLPSDPHPWIPFAFPCKLMPFQQGRGGIMAKGH